MKKSKKALLFLTVCLVALVVAVSLAACNNNQHTHTWGDWTVTEENKPTAEATGKATRVCSGEGECDASATDKEYVLPALTSEDYQTAVTTPATCSAQGVTTYIYNKNGVNVSFGVATPIDPAAHKYNYVDLGAQGHKGICEYNADHTTEVAEHDTDGEGGSCSVCGHTVITMGTAVTVSDASSFSTKRYFISLGAGEYELLIDGNAVDTNVTGCVAIIGTLNADYTIASVDTGTNRTVELEAGDYFVEVYVGGTLEVDVWANHQHAFSSVAFSNSPTHHWHTPICIHQDLEPKKCEGYVEHSFSAWSAPNEQGKQTRTCDECGYADTRDYPTFTNPETMVLGTNMVYLTLNKHPYWFEFAPVTNGKYIIIPNASATYTAIELHNNTTDQNAGANVTVSGTPLIVDYTGTPVKISVDGNDYNSFTIEVREYNETTDKGLTYQDPAQLENNAIAYNGNFYYTYRAEKSGLVTITFNPGTDSGDLFIFQYKNNQYEYYEPENYDDYNIPGSGKNSYAFEVKAGETYYVKTETYTSVNGTLSVEFKEFVAHNYVIKLGENETAYTGAGAIVNLVYYTQTGDEDPVKNTITGGEAVDGAYTFSDVDPSKDYTVEICGMKGFGYYSEEAIINKNVDTTTQFTVNLYELQSYQVYVTLPKDVTLVGKETLKGINVTLRVYSSDGGRSGEISNALQSFYTAQTNESGVATFNILDPAEYNPYREMMNFDVEYVIDIEVPVGHSLRGKYAYFVEEDYYMGPIYETLGKMHRNNQESPSMLVAVNEYTVVLKDSDNADIPSDVVVRIDGSIVKDGKVVLKADTDMNNITIEAMDHTFSNITVNGSEISANFVVDSKQLVIDVAKAFKGGAEGKTMEFDFTATESGNYTFVIDSEDTGKDIAFQIGYGQYMFDDYENSLFSNMEYELTATISLEAGKTYHIMLSSFKYVGADMVDISGTITVTKAA